MRIAQPSGWSGPARRIFEQRLRGHAGERTVRFAPDRQAIASDVWIAVPGRLLNRSVRRLRAADAPDSIRILCDRALALLFIVVVRRVKCPIVREREPERIAN